MIPGFEHIVAGFVTYGLGIFNLQSSVERIQIQLGSCSDSSVGPLGKLWVNTGDHIYVYIDRQIVR